MTTPAKTQGMLLVISGPSGVGKTTITHRVEKELHAVFSVSVTTRPKSETDRDGVDYSFIGVDEFKRRRDAGELLEWAEVFGNFYGTPRKPVMEAMAQGRLVILEIDVEGAIQVKHNLPESYAVFVLPPNERILLSRLRKRAREDESVIQRRFAKAKFEINHAWECGAYDEFIVNRDLEHAVSEAVGLIRAEMQRRAASAR